MGHLVAVDQPNSRVGQAVIVAGEHGIRIDAIGWLGLVRSGHRADWIAGLRDPGGQARGGQHAAIGIEPDEAVNVGEHLRQVRPAAQGDRVQRRAVELGQVVDPVETRHVRPIEPIELVGRKGSDLDQAKVGAGLLAAADRFDRGPRLPKEVRVACQDDADARTSGHRTGSRGKYETGRNATILPHAPARRRRAADVEPTLIVACRREYNTTGSTPCEFALLDKPAVAPKASLETVLSLTAGRRAIATRKFARGVHRERRANENSPVARHDYIAPGLARIDLDASFPFKILGDPYTCAWPYLRRDIPHFWCLDRRTLPIGFVSRDEAHILYNSALPFAGRRALEIGCWVGWSACHLARAGVVLDVIDPVLERPEFRGAVAESLATSGARADVNLVGGLSPQKVHELAAAGRRWSLLFIDGNHDAPFPLNDAIACEPYAEPDALVLFHDLASPEVSPGLDYLQDRGWQTMVYQTMQVMGVAWRGNVRPVEHFPDPSIHWPWPAYLRRHPVSGWSQGFDPDQAREEFGRLAAAVRPFTRLGEGSLTSLYTLARTLCSQDLPGDLVECGADRGGAAALLARVIKTYSKRPRKVLVGNVNDSLPAICRQMDVSELVVPLEERESTQPGGGPIALLHVSTIDHQATSAALNRFFDRVTPGGMIQFSDYGRVPEVKRAVHEFERARGLQFDLNPTDESGAWLRKG